MQDGCFAERNPHKEEEYQKDTLSDAVGLRMKTRKQPASVACQAILTRFRGISHKIQHVCTSCVTDRAQKIIVLRL